MFTAITGAHATIRVLPPDAVGYVETEGTLATASFDSSHTRVNCRIGTYEEVQF